MTKKEEKHFKKCLKQAWNNGYLLEVQADEKLLEELKIAVEKDYEWPDKIEYLTTNDLIEIYDASF
jgi:hypothetical protein